MSDPVGSEVDQIRRSAAIGNGLTRADAERLLELVAQLLAERDEVRRTLEDLGPSWQSTRAALNRLSRLMRS